MAHNYHATVPVPTAYLNRMILLLAGTVLIASIAVFCIVDLTLHQGVVQALLISVIPNIIASVFIYIAIYFSLSHLDNLRQQTAQQELVDRIISSISSVISAAPNAPAVAPSRSPYANQHIAVEQRIIIQRFLDAIHAFSVALTGNSELRLYCHVANRKDGTLHPVCTASGIERIYYDFGSDIPYRGPEARSFIIAKAMNRRRVIAEDLPDNHQEFYPDELKTMIPANLKCIIASPIQAFEPGSDEEPLGTISIDSTSAYCTDLGFIEIGGGISSKFDIMLMSCSRALYQVLAM